MQEFEVDSEGNGFETVPSEVLLDLMFNIMEELERRLVGSKPN